MGILSNLSRITSRSFWRLGDATFRRRLADMNRAAVTFGDGKFKSYCRTVKDLLRTFAAQGMTHPDECLLLMRLASQVRDGVIVEIGSYRGRSTIALAMGSCRGAATTVYAIEPHEEFTGMLGAHFGPDDKAAFERNIERARGSESIRAWTESMPWGYD